MWGEVDGLTCSDDFLLGDVVGVDLAGELEDGRVGVLVRVGVHVGLQGLQLLWSGGQGVGGGRERVRICV